MEITEEQRQQMDKMARKMPDAELQDMRESQTHLGELHKAALREIFRRKKEKEEKDDHRQNRIEKYTFIILVLTVLLVIITLRDCFH